MIKNTELRQVISTFTDKQFSDRVVNYISFILIQNNKDLIKRIVSEAEKLQETRNQHRKPPLKRLSFRIIEEVVTSTERIPWSRSQ